MKIRLIVRHTSTPKNPKRTVIKTVKYHANADGTVTTSSSKKVVPYEKPVDDKDNANMIKNV